MSADATHPALDVPVQLADDGREVTLRELGGGQPMLVLLARHMDCPYCEVYVGKVMRDHGDIGRVVLVGHGTAAELAAHHVDAPTEFVVVADPGQHLYDALQAKRAHGFGMHMPRLRNLWLGFRHAFRGGKLKRPGQDIRQLGADAVFDADARLTWVHLPVKPDDRPSTERLAEVMQLAA